MIPISADTAEASKALYAAYTELKRNENTEPYGLAVKWIECLIVSQQAHMADCNPAKLEASQIRLKQLLALRKALAAPGGAFTGHMFD